MPTLILVNEAREPRHLPLREAVTTMGRAATNHLVLKSRRVSRHHAVIDRQGGFVTLRDLGSTNGTFVNGTRTSVCPLLDGDTIRLADVEMKLADGEGQEAIATQTPLWETSSADAHVANEHARSDQPSPKREEAMETDRASLDSTHSTWNPSSERLVAGRRAAAWVGEALAFTFPAQGRRVAALITYEALRDHFGAREHADADSEAVRIYLDNEVAINVAAAVQYEKLHHEPVLLRTSHF